MDRQFLLSKHLSFTYQDTENMSTDELFYYTDKLISDIKKSNESKR